jgi:hypothetical protein
MRRAPLLAAALLGLAAAAGAQDTDNRGSPVFLERSYIYNRMPSDGLLFEALLAPHIFLYQGFYQRAGRVYSDPPVWATAVSFTPMVRLRMFDTESRPVRTPSYMPKLTVQLFRASLVDRSQRLDSPIRLIALNVIPFGHHSNGQEGCLFTDQVKVDDECRDPAPLPQARRTTNTTDGSFSTNYVRAELAYRHLRLADDPDGSLRGNQTCTFALGAELHPGGYGPGAISADQKALYPTFRVQPAIELSRRVIREAWYRGRFTGGVRSEYLRPTHYDVRPWAHTVEATYTFDRVGGWGPVVRYYDGIDYYNLGFLRNIRHVQIGIVFDAIRADEFGLPPNQSPATGPPGRANLLDRVCTAVMP